MSASGFRILCPSSNTAYPHRTVNKSSRMPRKHSYVVIAKPFGSLVAFRMAFFIAFFLFPLATFKASCVIAESCKTTGFSSGAQIFNSRRHWRNIVAGHTTTDAWYKFDFDNAPRKAATCTVFPKPISSPIIPPAL